MTRTSKPGDAAGPSDGRDRVLHEARALFVEEGFDGVSMQQIADAAGLTKAALYYHFRDKEDLFGHVVRGEMDRLRRTLTAAVKADGDLRVRLERAVNGLFVSVHSDFGRLMGDFKAHVSEQRRHLLGCDFQPPLDILRPCFARAQDEGDIRADVDLDLVISLFFGMVFGHLHQARLGETEAPPAKAVAAAIVGMVLNGIGTGPGDDAPRTADTVAANTSASAG